MQLARSQAVIGGANVFDLAMKTTAVGGSKEVRNTKYEDFFGSRIGLGSPFPVLCDGTPAEMSSAFVGTFHFKNDIVT